MNDIKRYEMWCDYTHGHNLSEEEKGTFVKYSDIEGLLREKDKELLAVKIVEKKPDLVIDNSGNSDNIDLKVVN